MGNLIRWLLLPVISLLITGCDFGLSLGDDGTIRSSTNKDIIRGLAGAYETVRESEGESSARRDLIMREAVKNNANLDGKFIEYLESNPNYSNVKVSGMSKSSGEGMINVSTVSFDVKNEFSVILRFITEEATVIGPLRWHKLPVLSEYQIEVNKKTIPFQIDSAMVMFGIINKNKNQFADFFAKIINGKKDRDISYIDLNSGEQMLNNALEISRKEYNNYWIEFQVNRDYHLSQCVDSIKFYRSASESMSAEQVAQKECVDEATRIEDCMKKVGARADFCYFNYSTEPNKNLWVVLSNKKEAVNRYIQSKIDEKDPDIGGLPNTLIPILLIHPARFVSDCIGESRVTSSSSDNENLIINRRECNINIVKLNQCFAQEGKNLNDCIGEIFFSEEREGVIPIFGAP